MSEKVVSRHKAMFTHTTITNLKRLLPGMNQLGGNLATTSCHWLFSAVTCSFSTLIGWQTLTCLTVPTWEETRGSLLVCTVPATHTEGGTCFVLLTACLPLAIIYFWSSGFSLNLSKFPIITLSKSLRILSSG